MYWQVANLLGEEIPQIWALCGRGSRSSLRVLRPGLAVTEMAVSPLPGAPQAVFTVRRSQTDEFDAYIVVSFTNATLVSVTFDLQKQGNSSATSSPSPAMSNSTVSQSPLQPLSLRGRAIPCAFWTASMASSWCPLSALQAWDA